MGVKKTLSILDIKDYGNDTIYKYGIDKAWDEFQVVLDAHNELEAMMRGTLVQGETNEQRHRFGAADSITFQDIELEFGRPDADAVSFQHYEIGLPLGLGGTGTQWTERMMQLITVQQFNTQLNAVLTADSAWLQYRMGKAIFGDNNYTYNDRYINNSALPVKRLLNADGDPIPVGRYNATFDGSTHTHYMVIDALDNDNIEDIQDNLTEHLKGSGKVVVLVNKAQTAAVLALTGFEKARDPRIVLGVNTAHLTPEMNAMYDNIMLDDRFLGVLEDGPEFWVKPWIPSGYGFAYIEGSELDKPLMARRDVIESSDLRVVEPTDVHPKLKARTVQRLIGFGVVERRNGVVFKIDAGLGAYTAPSDFA